jgi:hypothetical protein
LSQREIHRRTGLHPVNSEKHEIHRLWKPDPRLPGQRIRALIAPQDFRAQVRMEL